MSNQYPYSKAQIKDIAEDELGEAILQEDLNNIWNILVDSYIAGKPMSISSIQDAVEEYVYTKEESYNYDKIEGIL